MRAVAFAVTLLATLGANYLLDRFRFSASGGPAFPGRSKNANTIGLDGTDSRQRSRPTKCKRPEIKVRVYSPQQLMLPPRRAWRYAIGVVYSFPL
jgi:hypothetical protein